MNPLYMLEIEFDIAALYRFLHIQGLLGREDGTELGYEIHAWLSAAFGEFVPKPWRLLIDKHRPPRILGYAPHDANILQQRINEFAEPNVLKVCPKPQLMIASRVMPGWQEGRKLGFQTLVCPVGRKARSGVEKDLFLIHADSQNNDDAELCRETIYCDWVKKRFNNYQVTVDSVRLTGFRLVKQKRQTQSQNKKRIFRRIVRPQALIEGEITIENPNKFNYLLQNGMGRHRAFGYGMILLRPRK